MKRGPEVEDAKSLVSSFESHLNLTCLATDKFKKTSNRCCTFKYNTTPYVMIEVKIRNANYSETVLAIKRSHVYLVSIFFTTTQTIVSSFIKRD